MSAVVAFLLMSWPILTTLGLLAHAAWRERRRAAMVARQVRLTDAIADELGAIVAPVVTESLRGSWRVEIRVPVGRSAAVGRMVAIAHDTLTRAGTTRYELVLTPQVGPKRPLGAVTRRIRRIQAA